METVNSRNASLARFEVEVEANKGMGFPIDHAKVDRNIRHMFKANNRLIGQGIEQSPFKEGPCGDGGIHVKQTKRL